MDWDVTSAMDGDVLVVTSLGRTTEENVYAIARRFLDILSEAKRALVLIDNRQLESRLSLVSTFFLVRDLPGRPISVMRLAIVDREENRAFAEFHETTSANAGQPLTYFFDYHEALQWLRRT